MIADAPPLWLPPKPAIVRPAEHALLRPGAFAPVASRAERRALVAELVRSKRLTFAEAKRAMFFVPMVAWKAKGITSISLATSATGTSGSLTVPAGVVAGDILVFINRAHSGSTPSDTIPTGFAKLGTGTEIISGSRRQTISYKFADGTESGTSLSAFTGGSATRTILLVFRATKAASSVTAAGYVGSISDTDPAAVTILASGGAAPLIAIAVYGSSGGPTTNTLSVTAGGTLAHASGRLTVVYNFYVSGPVDETADMGDEGSGNSVQGGYLQIA